MKLSRTLIATVMSFLLPVVLTGGASAAGTSPTVNLTLGKSSTYAGQCTYDIKWSGVSALTGSTKWYAVIGNPGRQPYAPQFYIVSTNSQAAKGQVTGTDTTGVLTSGYFGKDPYGFNSPIEIWLVKATSTPPLARPTVYQAYNNKITNRC